MTKRLVLAACVFCALAGCGNKGPLVRPQAQPAAQTADSVPGEQPADAAPADQPATTEPGEPMR